MSKTLYATFQGGQVVLDEPSTKIPEGTRLTLVLPDNDTERDEDNDEGMDDEERAELDTFLEKSLKSAERGKVSREEVQRRMNEAK